MAEITAWAVSDFKSLSGVRLELPDLTILAGANSSGKSSTLQSVLMLAQTVTRGGPIVLNGPLVRLGLPMDVVRKGQKSIQLRLESKESVATGKSRVSDVELRLSIAPNADQSALEVVSLEILDVVGASIITATTERMSTADRTALGEIVPTNMTLLRVATIGGRRAPSRMYLGCSGLLPISLIVHRSPTQIRKSVRGALDAILRGPGIAQFSYELVQELNRLVDRRAFLESMREEIATREGVERTLFERPGVNHLRWTGRDLAELPAGMIDPLISAVADGRSSMEWVVVSPNAYVFAGSRARPGIRRSIGEGLMEDLVANEFESPLQYMSAASFRLQEFGWSTRYLGPLRDEPRVVHGAWDERVDALPVGIKGELTAEVLTRQRNQNVSYRDWENRPRRKTLPDAVAEWCSYFGIGDHIEVLDLGKLGRGVELRVNGVHRDLTTIGVGASQLLPVLVAGLTIPSGSTLLVEQPELHLHPLVQSRLADFFLFARDDVKFVVETHSEYLITRIRRRVAEEQVNPVAVEVLFASQENGATTVEALQLSTLGDFDSWPKGFFDAQDADSLSIVRAVTSRLTRGNG